MKSATQLLTKLSFIGVLVVGMSGCGGEGSVGNSTAHREINRWLDDYQWAIENENLQLLEDITSFDYFNDCQTFDDLMDAWDTLFRNHNNWRFSVLSVSDFASNGNQVRAWIRTRTTASGGYLDNSEGFLFLRREGGVWRLFGDQTCTRSVAKDGSVRILSTSTDWPVSDKVTPRPAK